MAGLMAGLMAGCAAPPRDLPPATGWEALAPGVGYRVLQPRPDAVLHLLRLDLRQPGLRLRLSPPGEAGKPIDAMPSGRGALVSINASFFGRGWLPLGLTRSDGVDWPGATQPDTTALFGCEPTPRCAFLLDAPVSAPASWTLAVGGRPWLVRDGRARTAADDAACQAFCARPHPRTAVALDTSGRWLLLALAEGRRPGVPGMALADLAGALRDQGAQVALNLDGGGSSSLLIRGQPAMARPANEPAQRPLANAIHVFVDAPPH